MSELNRVLSDEVGSTFTEALLQNKSLRLERKKNSTEKRREKRQLHREVTHKISESFAENAAISMLTEGESMRKYHRKRLAQSFHAPKPAPPAKKLKSHSPNFSNVPWDAENLKVTLQTWPSDELINWSAVAKENGIPANPSVCQIDAEIREMILSGRFSLGEECSPFTITKFHLKDGILSPHDTQALEVYAANIF